MNNKIRRTSINGVIKYRQKNTPVISALASAILLALGLSPAQAVTINVDGSSCTLSEAIRTANTGNAEVGCTTGVSGGPDTITLASQIYTYLSPDPVDADGKNALPSINSEITIEGNGATIERDAAATGDFRLIHVAAGGDLTINDLTLKGGRAIDSPGADAFNGIGGAIFNQATVNLNRVSISGNSATNKGGGLGNFSIDVNWTVTDSTISGNTAGSGGGGFFRNGNTRIVNSVVSGNTAALGGGLYATGGTSLEIDRTSVSGNTASSMGGGMYVEGVSTLDLSNSTLSDNTSAKDGGGLWINHVVFPTLSNTTLSGNSATVNGGGISLLSGGTNLKLIHVTISGNTATNGSGLDLQTSNTSLVTVGNSIIASNQGSSDCRLPTSFTLIDPEDSNWFGDASCNGTADGDPMLGSLADNGGLTRTRALLAGSPAIDVGNSTICAASPIDSLDQRGIARPADACDLGAFERTAADEEKNQGFFVLPARNGKLVVIPL